MGRIVLRHGWNVLGVSELGLCLVSRSPLQFFDRPDSFYLPHCRRLDPCLFTQGATALGACGIAPQCSPDLHALRASAQREQSPECQRRFRSAAVTSETRNANGQLRLPWQSCFKRVQARSRRTAICETDRSSLLSHNPASVRSLMYCQVLVSGQHCRRSDSGSCRIQNVSLSVGMEEVEVSDCSIV